MPDLIALFGRWWKLILGLTLLFTLIAFLIVTFSDKQYLSTATALPANSVVADKARIFNNNIEALYSELGTPDELDRLEGTAVLDTLYIASARAYDLATRYGLGKSGESDYKAAMKLKKNSKIARSAFGELKVKVWHEDRNLAAALANHLMEGMQGLHQQLQSENNRLILEKIREDYTARQNAFKALVDSSRGLTGGEAEIANAKRAALLEQLQQYETMVNQYELSVRTNPAVLLTVERARPSIWPDRPRLEVVVLLTFILSLAATTLLALFLDTRSRK